MTPLIGRPLRLNRELRRKCEFIAIGTMVMLASFAQLWLYISVLHMEYWYAYGLQTLVSIELSFVGNYYVSWRDRRHASSFFYAHWMFLLTRAVSIALNVVVFMVFSFAGCNYFIAQALAVIIGTIFTYTASDRLVFKQRTS